LEPLPKRFLPVLKLIDLRLQFLTHTLYLGKSPLAAERRLRTPVAFSFDFLLVGLLNPLDRPFRVEQYIVGGRAE